VSDTLKRNVIKDINALIAKVSVRWQKHFADVKTRPETKELIDRPCKTQDEIAQRNRLLLEDAYPKELLAWKSEVTKDKLNRRTEEFLTRLHEAVGQITGPKGSRRDQTTNFLRSWTNEVSRQKIKSLRFKLGFRSFAAPDADLSGEPNLAEVLKKVVRAKHNIRVILATDGLTPSEWRGDFGEAAEEMERIVAFFRALSPHRVSIVSQPFPCLAHEYIVEYSRHRGTRPHRAMLTSACIWDRAARVSSEEGDGDEVGPWYSRVSTDEIATTDSVLAFDGAFRAYQAIVSQRILQQAMSCRPEHCKRDPEQCPFAVLVSGASNIPERIGKLRCHGSWTFSEGELPSLRSLASKLEQRKRAFDAWLIATLPNATQTLLVNHQGRRFNRTVLRRTLVHDLNAILTCGASIHDQERFKDIRLRPETRKLLKMDLQKVDLAHLNRLLIEDAYPEVLKKGEQWKERKRALQDQWRAAVGQRTSGSYRKQAECLASLAWNIVEAVSPDRFKEAIRLQLFAEWENRAMHLKRLARTNCSSLPKVFPKIDICDREGT